MGKLRKSPNLVGLKDVLALAVRGAPFSALIDSLLQAAHDVLGQHAKASIYILDDTFPRLKLIASVGLPKSLIEAIKQLPVGETEASSGRAAYLSQPVIVEDVLLEPRLKPYLHLAKAHDIRSCWSFPLHSPAGKTMGAIAFYHPDARVPDEALEKEIGYFADLAALVVERHLTERENSRKHSESQRQLAEMAIESERWRRLYETVLSNTPDLVYVFDLDHRFTYANKVLLQMWNKTWDEAIGKTCLELGYEPWHAEMHDREIEEVKATLRPVRGEVPFEGAFGRRIYDYILVPVVGPEGSVEAVAGTTRDVTERKQFEEELMASQRRAVDAAREAEEEKQRLTALLEAVPVGIGYADANGKLVRINAANLRLWGGMPEANEVGEYRQWRAWWADGSERDGQPLDAHEWGLAKALNGVEVTGDRIEIERFDASQSRRHVLLRATPVRDDQGKVFGAVVAQMDVTEQRRSEIALRESEQRFRTITNAMPQMVWTALPDGAIDYHNDQFYEFVGLARGEAEGVSWADLLLHPDDREAGQAAWKQSIAAGAPYEMTYRLRHHSGQYRWILARALPLHNDNGDIVKWMGTDTDIHEKTMAEEALKEANQRKDEFLAMLAHELRNPLAPISAAADVLDMVSDEPEKVRRYSRIIARQVSHMTSLMNDLLDVSRVTRGMVEIEKHMVDLKSVVTSAAEQVHPLIDSRKHRLELRLGSAPAYVNGDQARLIQVVVNLLANAAKYTPAGGYIDLTLQVSAGRVTIRVTDDGGGIDPLLLPHVFDLFTQGKRTPDRAQGGLGLGLALVRSLIALHDGMVSVESAGPGCGSTFTVELPLLDAGPGQLPPNADGRKAVPLEKALRVMLVDDNVDAGSSLAALLEATGHSVETLTDPGGVVAAAGVLRPDVFILDIGMPVMNGYELARQLRQTPHARYATYIALTGYGQQHDKEMAIAAGFDHHLVKPVNPAQLLTLLSIQQMRREPVLRSDASRH